MLKNIGQSLNKDKLKEHQVENNVLSSMINFKGYWNTDNDPVIAEYNRHM